MIKVIDLCPFLGFEPIQIAIKHQLLIVSATNEIFAILIDNVSDIVKIKEEEFQNLPYDTKNHIIEQIYKIDQYSISIINAQKINKIT